VILTLPLKGERTVHCRFEHGPRPKNSKKHRRKPVVLVYVPDKKRAGVGSPRENGEREKTGWSIRYMGRAW